MANNPEVARPIALDDAIAISTFGVACIVGLVGAFVGLGVSSFWVDELYTAWIIGRDSDFAQMLHRAITDTHPPVYYTALFFFSHVFGGSDASLRVFSSLSACAAILVFFFATRRTFSFQARLFAAAMATGSNFWYYQAQNARDYTLCLLIGAIALAISLRILAADEDSPKRRYLFILLFATLTVGSFTHFYVFYESIAIMGFLFLFRRRDRWIIAVMSIVLTGLVGSYVKLVVPPFSEVSHASIWIHNDPAWYAGQFVEVWQQTANKPALAALAICVVGFGVQHWRRLPRLIPVEPELALCVGVPLAVLVAGVGTSFIIAPNFTDRNFLVCSPFLWGVFAKAFDAGVAGLRGWIRPAAIVALCGLMLVMSTIVISRTMPRNEPFRETAAWIRHIPSCKASDIPVAVDQTDPVDALNKMRGDVEPTRARWENEYDRYLDGYAGARAMFFGEINDGRLPEALRREIANRIKGRGCPVIVWADHIVSEAQVRALAREIVLAAGPPSTVAIYIKEFHVYKYGLNRSPLPPEGFIVYAAPPGAAL